MLACRIHAKEDLRIEAVDVRPSRVRAKCCCGWAPGGICGSDLHYYFEGRNGNFIVREPLIPGHEASAVVAGVGDGVTRVKVGDKVAVSPSHACGRCEYCREGREHLCSQMRFLGSASRFPHVQGMFQEYLRDGRAAVLSGRRRHLARRARVRRAARRRPARRQPRRRPARQVGADHRRRHDRLRHRDGGAARRRAQGHGHRRARPAAGAGEARRRGRRRCAPIATATRSRIRSSTSPTKCPATSTRSRPASPRPSAAASSCRSARCRTSRCRSSSTS